MGRRKKNDFQIDGQLTFDFCIEPSYQVVQANKLIGGKQMLKLNSAKIIRAAIMQIKPKDQEIKPYAVSITELAQLLGIPKNDLYRDVKGIAQDIFANPIYIKNDDKTGEFFAIPWVQLCGYQPDVGFVIQLNSVLKPWLLNLKEHYTQYPLENILAMKSVYAIRIFELLQEKHIGKQIPLEGVNIEISVQEIRECCGLEAEIDKKGNVVRPKKYEKFSHFRERVLDTAVNEINRIESSNYHVSYKCIKTGRTVTSILFNLNVDYHLPLLK